STQKRNPANGNLTHSVHNVIRMMLILILLLGCILQLRKLYALELSVLGIYSCGEAEYDVGCSVSSFMLPSFMMGLREGGVMEDYIKVGKEKVYIEWYNPVTDFANDMGSRPSNFDLAVNIAMRESNKTIGFVGFDDMCTEVSNLARSMNLLLVSSQCEVEVGEASYPSSSVIQMQVTEIEKQRALASLLLTREWTEVGIIHAESAAPNQIFYRESLISILSDAGIKINNVAYCQFKDRSDMKYTQMVMDTIYKARIIIVVADLAPAKTILDKLYLMGALTNGDFFVINMGPTKTQSSPDSGLFWKNPISTPPSLRTIPTEIYYTYFNSFGFFTNDRSIKENFSKKWTAFVDRLSQFMDEKKCPLLCKYDMDNSYDWNPTTGFTYENLDWKVIADAYIAGHIIAKQLPSLDPRLLTDGEAVASHLRNYTYTTLRDVVSRFRGNGVAPDVYYLLRGFPSLLKDDITVRMAETVPNYENSSTYDYSSEWFGDAKNLSILFGRWPEAVPPCGFSNEKCPPTTPPFTDAEIAVIAASVGAALILLAVIIYILRWLRYERRLESDYWLIERAEITLMDLTRFGSSRANSDFMGSMMSSKSLDDDGPSKGTIEFYHQNIKREARQRKKKLAEAKNVKKITNSGENHQWEAIEDNQLARFQGQLVILRRINKSSMRLTREMKRELDLLMHMKDENVNIFLGLVNKGRHIFTLSAFGPRKSLDDLLRNQDLRLDKMFKISFAEDIIKGMRYLHTKSKIGFHGNLKSTNSIVDAYWRVKLCGFGQHKLREGAPMERQQSLLWTAPEILRILPTNMAKLPREMAQRADIYAVGTILYEIYGRQGPFGDDLIDTSQIIEAVKAGSHDGVVARPDISLIQKAPPQIRDMVSRCWFEDPRTRPNITKIKEKIAKVNYGKRTNIADNIMELLDRYKYNLTDMIEERTKDLDEERRRNESLLLQLLPKSVADKLKSGSNVDAMLFDSVTIYFSDIVGFTSLSSRSTPLQIVNMLNDLYTRFDSTIDVFDCYKIETIGDAYMYVSGLPELNGNAHVGEVAGAALELLELIKTFEVRHLPDDKLRLRIGIHTGPVITGVVGVKMPRYCLFGETVITASMMESSGEAMKIQLSVDAFKTLTMCGGFKTELRGDITLKTNEKMRSYWLLAYNQEFRLSRLKADLPKFPHLARIL
ncbi:hypothetical protein PMAYCL1PPCAC_30975, partial [Pristionchus mayeri]